MTSKAEDKVEIVVQVESKDTSSKVILIMLIIVLVGLVIAVMMTGGPDALLSNDDDILAIQREEQKKLFKNKIKSVEAGANGTLEYTIKEGVNKGKIADDKILKNKD